MDFFTQRIETIKIFLDSQSIPKLADIERLFSWSYWTEGPLDEKSPFYLAGSIAVVLLLISFTIYRYRLKRLQKLTPVFEVPINHLLNIIILIIIMTISYITFRRLELAYLSSRLIVLSTALIVGGWLLYLLIYLKRVIPSKRRYYLERERFFRYLPKVSQTKR